jgi:ribonuclease-3 family protein
VQAQIAEALLEDLTEEELACYKRGRNAKSHSVAKNASIAEYRKATGLEALYGYLYLSGREDRLLELTKLGLEKINKTI